MEISIDFAIQLLQADRNDYRHDTVSNWALSLDTAIDTMCKYQKIEQIAFPLQFCSTDKLDHEAIMKICEVLEDESDDCN